MLPSAEVCLSFKKHIVRGFKPGHGVNRAYDSTQVNRLTASRKLSVIPSPITHANHSISPPVEPQQYLIATLPIKIAIQFLRQVVITHAISNFINTLLLHLGIKWQTLVIPPTILIVGTDSFIVVQVQIEGNKALGSRTIIQR